ncbi:MAG: MFS transporter [Desulfatiglandales bacterium]
MKILLLFWGLWFLNFSTRTILSPLLPIFEKEMGFGYALAGSLFLYLSLGYTGSLVAAGWIVPRVGFKKAIALGFFILIAAFAALVLIKSYAHLVVVAFFLGLGGGIYLPCALPLLTSAIPPDKWGKSIAFHETAASSSILATPLLVAAALAFTGWPTLVMALSALCLAMILTFLILLPEPSQKGEDKFTFSRVLHRRDFWIMAVLWAFAAAGGLGLYNLIPLFLVNEKGLPLDTANTVFGVSRLGGLALIFVAGFLMDRFGVRKVLLASLLVSGFATAGLAVAQGFTLVVGMLVLQATSIPVFFPAGLVAISRLTDYADRSAFTGATLAVGVVFGTGIAPTLLGFIADIRDFQTGIFFQGVLTMLACVLLPLLRKIRQ